MKSKGSSFKVAIVQHPPVFLNLSESLNRARQFTNDAAKEGARVVVFPETWLPGYPVWLDYSPNAAIWDHPPAKALFHILVENSLNLKSQAFQNLLAMAKKAKAHIIMGAHELVGGTLYNTMIYAHKNGSDFQLHRKLMPTYSERMIWGTGDGSTLGVLETEFGNIGGLICWEHWMPLARAAMHAKNEVLHVAQWPMVKEGNHLASRHYAFEGQCFVAAAGCVLGRGEILEGFDSLQQKKSPARELLEAVPGNNRDLILRGGSAVIAPNAEYVVGPVYDQPGIIYAEIDPGLITEGRLALDTDGHYARPDVFRLEVNEREQETVTYGGK